MVKDHNDEKEAAQYSSWSKWACSSISSSSGGAKPSCMTKISISFRMITKDVSQIMHNTLQYALVHYVLFNCVVYER